MTRLPSGVRSCTRAGSVLFLAPARAVRGARVVLVVRLAPVAPDFVPAVPVLLPVVPALPAALRLRAALLSTVTCAPPSFRPPGLPVGQCGSPVSTTGHGVGATRPGTGVTGAPASALQPLRYPVLHNSVKPHLTCDFAWISK
ncbi:hypothetical protein SGPA1_50350 [Streptomyces misionensis JCM 4497]